MSFVPAPLCDEFHECLCYSRFFVDHAQYRGSPCRNRGSDMCQLPVFRTSNIVATVAWVWLAPGLDTRYRCHGKWEHDCPTLASGPSSVRVEAGSHPRSR